jgi:xylulokinase
MDKELVIGVDCSTTSVKAIAWDRRGNNEAEARQKISLHSPREGWYEQKPEEWWTATAKALRSVAKCIDTRLLRSVCITHQRETFVPVDDKVHPLMNAISFFDSRAANLVGELKGYGAGKLQRISGIYPNQNTTLTKLLWLKENEKEAAKKTFKYMDVGSYLVWKLTGQVVTTGASIWPFGIYDLKKRRYSREIIEAVGARVDQFCDLADAGAILGRISGEVASKLQLPEGTPVIGGGGDGQCAALGSRLVAPGSCSINLGTVVVAEFFSKDPVVGEHFRTACACLPRSYIAESVIPGGMFTVTWFLREFGLGGGRSRGKPEAFFEQEADKVSPASLIAVPYWNGAAAPYWNSSAKGIVLGWDEKTTRAHLYRSIIESIFFEQRFLSENIQKTIGDRVERVTVCGGGANSRLFRQILADILGVRVTIPRTLETTCLGAGVLAAFAAGFFPDIPQAAKAMCGTMREEYLPIESNRNLYEKIFRKVYCKLYPANQQMMNDLAQIRRRYGS